MLVALSLGVSAAATHLSFSKVDAKVGSKTSKDLDEGETINDEAAPGDQVEFKIKMENNFTDAQDVDIDNVQVTVTIEGVDDGDDLDDEANDFDLAPGRSKSSTVSFTLPDEVGEGTYDVTIEAEGDTDRNGTQISTMKLVLEVKKEKHELRLTRTALSPEQVKCSRNAQLGVTVLNTGQEDEDDNTLTVSSSELGIDFKDTFDVVEGDFDEDMKFSKTYSFSVPKDLGAGSYPIAIRSTFDDGKKSVSKNVDMVVQECTTAEATASVAASGSSAAAPAKPAETTTVVMTQPLVAQQTTAEIIQPTTAQPAATETAQKESLFDSPGFFTGFVVVEVLIVVVGIAFVAYLMRRS